MFLLVSFLKITKNIFICFLMNKFAKFFDSLGWLLLWTVFF